MPTELDTKLLPCPHCGGKAETHTNRIAEDVMEAFVMCSACFATTDNFEDAYAPTADAIAAWNRRSSLPQPAQALDPRALAAVKIEWPQMPDDIIAEIIDDYLSALTPSPPSVVTEAKDDPMQFFSENVDRWGAIQWFDRLAKAIHSQDKSVVDGDDLMVSTYRSIAASSAMNLVRDFEPFIRAALEAALSAPAEGGEAKATDKLLAAVIARAEESGFLSVEDINEVFSPSPTGGEAKPVAIYHACEECGEEWELLHPIDSGTKLYTHPASKALLEEVERVLERTSLTVKRYRRAGLGDDVFHSDLCETDTALDALLTKIREAK